MTQGSKNQRLSVTPNSNSSNGSMQSGILTVQQQVSPASAQVQSHQQQTQANNSSSLSSGSRKPCNCTKSMCLKL